MLFWRGGAHSPGPPPPHRAISGSRASGIEHFRNRRHQDLSHLERESQLPLWLRLPEPCAQLVLERHRAPKHGLELVDT